MTIEGDVMKIGITGDTHGDKDFKQIYEAKKQGYTHIIITGDFGYIWDNSFKEQKRLNHIDKIGIKILFIDGNHENHPLINSYPTVDIFNGKAHKITENITHLIRGEIYTINNKKIFTFGGADSIDRIFRKEGKTWWPEEMPTKKEMDYGIYNLEKHNYEIDYIITHTIYTKGLLFTKGFPVTNSLVRYFDFIKNNTNFKHWYFGHMHVDITNDKLNTTCLYKKIIKINI